MSRRFTLKERAAAVHIADILTYYYKKHKRVKSILHEAFMQQSAAQTIQHCYKSYRRYQVKLYLRDAFMQQSAAQTIQRIARKYNKKKRIEQEERDKELSEAVTRRTPTPHPERCSSRTMRERPDISRSSPPPFISTSSVPLL